MKATALVPVPMPAGILLIVAVVLSALTDAIASTVLSLGRGGIIGDTYATPDEIAWLDVGYTSLKLIGLVTCPWMLTRIGARQLILACTVAMGLTSALSAFVFQLGPLIALRIVQGFSGGALLVAGQTIIFLLYPRARQPTLQAFFAVGAVVAPATAAPALQGWLLDNESWTWIFLSIVPTALAAVGFLLLAGEVDSSNSAHRPFDWIGFLLISNTFLCFTYMLNQGSRWNWFEESLMVWLCAVGTASLLAFFGQQILVRGKGLLDFRVFGSPDFSFAFIASFVAGAALFGSAFLIPSFAVSVLSLTPTSAGLLLLPSGALFILALFVAAYLTTEWSVPPVAAAPVGILLTMVAMWMLAGSTLDSGSAEMTPAILIRGLGLGFLFLAITLIAFEGLSEECLASGIGIFNTGRQLGGLFGVAALQTLIDQHVAQIQAVLAANLPAGGEAVIGRIKSTIALLMSEGFDVASASRAAASLVGRVVTVQSTVIAFDTAFYAIVLLFVIAVPMLVSIKIGLARSAYGSRSGVSN